MPGILSQSAPKRHLPGDGPEVRGHRKKHFSSSPIEVFKNSYVPLLSIQKPLESPNRSTLGCRTWFFENYLSFRRHAKVKFKTKVVEHHSTSCPRRLPTSGCVLGARRLRAPVVRSRRFERHGDAKSLCQPFEPSYERGRGKNMSAITAASDGGHPLTTMLGKFADSWRDHALRSCQLLDLS